MHRQAMTDYGAPLETLESPTPTPTGSQVLMRVSHCGVCHSDLHLLDGHFELGDGKRLDVRSGRTLPFTLGHEIAGTVEALGPEAEGITKGQRFAVYPWIGCGTCVRCKAGNEHLCDKAPQLGITVDGGYASHVIVPHPRYLLDVQGIAPELAGSLMCSGLTAYSAILKALPYAGGGPLMIVGLGGVGMMGLTIARALAKGPIAAADIDPAKRAKAEAIGAQAFDPADAEARKTVLRGFGAAGAAIDFVGSESSLNFAQGVVGKAAAVVVAGLLGGKFSMPIPMFPLRQLAILGSYVGSLSEAQDLIALVKSGAVSPIPVRLRSLAEANQALDDLRQGRVIGRVVLTP